MNEIEFIILSFLSISTPTFISDQPINNASLQWLNVILPRPFFNLGGFPGKASKGTLNGLISKKSDKTSLTHPLV